MKKVPVGILGVGNIMASTYLQLLSKHPLFEVVFVAGSEQLPGKTASSGVYTASINEVERGGAECACIFSTLGPQEAQLWEPLYAKAGAAVISSSSAFRNEADIPLIIPEINSDHLQLIRTQQQKRNSRGFIVAKPNSAVQGILLPLWPLHKRFQIANLSIVNLQSGDRKEESPSSPLDLIDNIIPYIPGEEENIEDEPQKIFGHFQGEGISISPMAISSTSLKCAIHAGDMSCVSVDFLKKPKIEEILEQWGTFPGLSLPSAPEVPIRYMGEMDRPQPRLDREREAGMGITVGRLRSSSVHQYQFITLSHNLIRGGAGGGILIGEQLLKLGYVDKLWEGGISSSL